jgi:hypothetical protein
MSSDFVFVSSSSTISVRLFIYKLKKKMVSATTATSISSYVLGISRNKRDDDAVEDNNALAAYKYTQRAAGRSRKAVRSHRS